MLKNDITLGLIVKHLGGELIGSPNLSINRIASLEAASPVDISFIHSSKYASAFSNTKAACVIARRHDWQLAKTSGYSGAVILTDSPYHYYALLTQWWRKELTDRQATHSQPLIHPTAVIAGSAKIAPTAKIAAFCVIEEGAIVGARTSLAPHVFIGRDCQLGDDCIVHSGVVIGSDGFGFAPDPRDHEWVKIEQLGAVRIGHQVEIGANTCIDRGALEDTVIEDGVKLDNLIQIGHNVRIGKHSALAGCVGVAGSATIGAYCTVGGGAVILGHLTLADHVHISAASVVMSSISKPGQYTGVFPVDSNATWEKNAATLKQLHMLRHRIRSLEKN